MRNKFYLFLCSVALISLIFTSCRNKTDFDAICDDLTETTLSGLHSGSGAADKTLTVAQYNFLKDGTVEFTQMAVGDGVYVAPAVVVYSSYELGERNNGNLGRYILLNPKGAGEPKRVNFIRNGIVEDGLPVMEDSNDKVNELPRISNAITGKRWGANDTTFFRVDTIMDVITYDTIRHRERDPETGRYKMVVDSIVEIKTPTKMKYSVGPLVVKIRDIELYRDESTLANTGKYSYQTKEFAYDAERNQTLVKDSVSAYDFHWYYESYTSMAVFSIHTVPAIGEGEVFDIKYDSKIPAIIIDTQTLILPNEEE